MYVTRPLSLLRRSPELLNSIPGEGPNMGVLVIFDEECDTTTCFGLCKDTFIQDLPIPQNKDLTVDISDEDTTDYASVFIPVVNEPLSSNRYYVIQRKGKHRGEANTSSREADMETRCCCTSIKDVKSRPFDPWDTYQQFHIVQKNTKEFTALSVAPHAFTPAFLREEYWKLQMKTPRRYRLFETLGLDPLLRAALPDLRFSSNAVVIGRWYVPFMFVRENSVKLKDQMKRSMFYKITLQQRWERIFGCENDELNNKDLRVVDVCVVVDREQAFVGETEVMCTWGSVEDRLTWYRSLKGGESMWSLGLSVLVTERMRWEQERVGFVLNEGERRVEVKRTEVFHGNGGWRKFGCYVLVESFVLTRMDGSVLLTHDFKHTSQIRTKWE